YDMRIVSHYLRRNTDLRGGSLFSPRKAPITQYGGHGRPPAPHQNLSHHNSPPFSCFPQQRDKKPFPHNPPPPPRSALGHTLPSSPSFVNVPGDLCFPGLGNRYARLREMSEGRNSKALCGSTSDES